MMNGFYNIRSIERVAKTSKLSGQMSGQRFSDKTGEEQEVKFSDALKEACKHNEDSLARAMENKVNYYGSDAQAVYFTMTMSRSFKA